MDWYKVTNPQTNEKLFIQRLADGRWAIQFNEEATVLKTEREITEEYPQPSWISYPPDYWRWIPFEMLRRHERHA